MKKAAPVLGIAVALMLGWPRACPARARADGAGSVTGRVFLTGAPPGPGPVLDPFLLYAARPAPPPGPHHLVVYLRDVPGRPVPPSRPMLLDMKDNRFVPGLLPILAGGRVRFRDLDPVYHRPFSYSELRRFDLGRMAPGGSRVVDFPRLPSSGIGVVEIFCALHPEMKAFVLLMRNSHWQVLDESRAATPAGAPFRLKGVPPGRYTLGVWGPDFAPVSRPLRVKAGAASRADLKAFWEE